MKKIKVNFVASGYGSNVYRFATLEEARKWIAQDAEGVACDCDGEVENWGDEVVVTTNGEEVARYMIAA